ncbi:MAG TPA: phospholipase D family protein [Xanthomonadales bacterium]|nr:phospholipase D family protein [Xanthomonadales bacterium]
MNVAAENASVPLKATLERACAARPEQSCAVLLSDNRLALLSRLAFVDRAEDSIDVQYYIIRGDTTGLLLVQRLLAAADRGVRVRVLVDDVYTVGQEPAIIALDSHPAIELRLFNAFSRRHPSMLVRAWEALISRRPLMRRMHNKTFVVDRSVAIVGGRNLGDEYFDAADEMNFHDLDVALFGPAASEIAASFDCFWESPAASRVANLAHRGRDTTLDAVRRLLARHLERFRASDYLAALRDGDLLEDLEREASRAYWGRAEVIFDDPGKIAHEYRPRRRTLRRLRMRSAPRIVAAIESAQQSLVLISPYFVPGVRGCEIIEALRARGVAVKVLTNSLAATDVPAVHAGYERYRRRLLRAGVQIWELRAEPGQARRHAFGSSSSASLHAKAFTVDGRLAFVGSMNMDPRSAFLNTELGVLVESPGLAGRIEAYCNGIANLARSYRVTLERRHGFDRLRWDDVDAGGVHRTRYREPDATLARRAISQLIAWLPLESQL